MAEGGVRELRDEVAPRFFNSVSVEVLVGGDTASSIDWAPSGGSVFMTGGQRGRHRRIIEFRMGEGAADVVPVDVGDFYGLAVVDTAGSGELAPVKPPSFTS